MDRHLLLPDRRRLSYGEYGDPAGFPVVLCHGLPGSRFQRHPDDGLALRAGARIIVPERPGYGASSPSNRATVAAWAEDLAALADHLELARFALAGVSGGAPYALAGAHRLSGRTSRVALVSGLAPDILDHPLNPLASLAFRLARRGRSAVAPFLAMPTRLAARHPLAYLRMLAWQGGGSDRQVLERPEIRHLLAQDVRTALAQGAAGMAVDLASLARDWGFAPGRIAAPVAIWHGDHDRIVPPSCAYRLAEEVRGARLTCVPVGGHFMVFDLWPAVLEWLVQCEVREPALPGQAGDKNRLFTYQ